MLATFYCRNRILHTSPKLRNQNQAVEDKADLGSNDTSLRAESKLIQCVTLQLPCCAESNVAYANGSPSKMPARPEIASIQLNACVRVSEPAATT